MCGCGLCDEVHLQPKDPCPSYPAQGPNNRTKKTRFQGKANHLFVPVISLLPKPQTPLKSPGPHGCRGGGGDERVLGGKRGCGSVLPRVDRCGAASGAVPSHLILCHPLLLLPAIPPSIRVFSNESTLCMGWSKYWSFSFNISPSNEHPRLISFRMDWLDLLAVQGTLKSLLQHHSSKASILLCS